MLWYVGMKDQGAFGPQGALVSEAVAAVPSAGGAVTSLLTVGVGVMIAAVLNVAWIAVTPVLQAIEAISKTLGLYTLSVT